MTTTGSRKGGYCPPARPSWQVSGLRQDEYLAAVIPGADRMAPLGPAIGPHLRPGLEDLDAARRPDWRPGDQRRSAGDGPAAAAGRRPAQSGAALWRSGSGPQGAGPAGGRCERSVGQGPPSPHPSSPPNRGLRRIGCHRAAARSAGWTLELAATWHNLLPGCRVHRNSAWPRRRTPGSAPVLPCKGPQFGEMALLNRSPLRSGLSRRPLSHRSLGPTQLDRQTDSGTVRTARNTGCQPELKRRRPQQPPIVSLSPSVVMYRMATTAPL
jgi:hypothetical protein